VYEELKEVRNAHAGFAAGVGPGMAHAGLVAHLLKGQSVSRWMIKACCGVLA
jgi:hypothetical protein